MPSEKVLIVDDEKLVRWSLRQKCEEWGYHVLEADNGAAALRVAHNESPDLVLLDVRLPDASGIELLEQLKKSGDARAVIMITADPQLEDVKTALKLGAYDFVGKPLDFDELAVAVKNALEATRLRSEVESLRGEMRRRTGYHNVIGVSQKMSDLLGFVTKSPPAKLPPSWCKARAAPARTLSPRPSTTRAGARKSPSSPSTARPSRRR
jgi:DNA-binding NtrC family response regulator